MAEIMGHRGARSECKENTMEAFQKAVELDACGIESDVHMLFDGSLVMYHDAAIPETNESLYMFDGESVSSQIEDVVFFEEFLKYYSQTGKLLNIEIKDKSGFCIDIEEPFMALLQKYNMKERCIISCFNHYILREIKEKYPDWKVGALYRKRFRKDVVAYCKKYGIDAVHPHHTDVDRTFVEQCHEADIMVNVWTVNEEEDILRMNEIGVDIIMTDNIPLAKKLLQGE